MCSEKDCRLFKGMIRACDECRMYVALNENRVEGIQESLTPSDNT
ncbi:MAG: hypothetical protein OEM29_08210 [Thermoplasmata archaeon]|nr:hypothetical protein [Thermoplasmata archaeon]